MKNYINNSCSFDIFVVDKNYIKPERLNISLASIFYFFFFDFIKCKQYIKNG